MVAMFKLYPIRTTRGTLGGFLNLKNPSGFCVFNSNTLRRKFMKKVCIFLLITALAVSFAACGGAVENKPVNIANANVANPLPAAPTADTLLDMERQAQEAYTKGDSSYFEGMLSDKAIMSMGGKHMNKAGIVAMIKTAKCEMTDGAKLSEPQISRIDNDTYAFAYRNDSAGKCNEGPGGKMVEMKPTRAATVWVRNGGKWQAAWHNETTIIEPKGDPKKDEAKKADTKMEAAKGAKAEADSEAKVDAAKDVAKKEEPKKAEAAKKDEAAKKEESATTAAKKEEPKKDETKKDDKTAAAPVEAPKSDANTDALVKLHTSGWEAWKAKDAGKFNELLSSNIAVVDPIGRWFSGKDAVIKQWTETMKCEGVTKVSITDGFAAAISPTVEVLTVKGSSDGTCDGQKNGPLWQDAVYVKEGDAWKLAFMFETPSK
jgi:hypothetical protein